MKRFLFLSLAAAALLAGCGKTDEPSSGEGKTSLSVSPATLTFPADESTQSVTVTASGAWTASKSVSWITLSTGSGSGSATVEVTAGYHKDAQPRKGKITFQSKDLSVSTEVEVTQNGYTEPQGEEIVPSPAPLGKDKLASTTYQLLVYSFADSDGDGIGDFKGIENKLDYLDGLGVTALWLSPIHPSDSYHGYNVQDYYAVNLQYGTEADFKSLIDKAHQKGIRIYIDYVLNHSGKGNPWFAEALSSASSPYRDYYFISSNPSSDYGNFPMLKGTKYVSGEWKKATSGSPKITVTKTTDPVRTGSSSWNLWLWKIGQAGDALQFVDRGDGTYFLVADIDGNYGMLVRKEMNWNDGSKFGASGAGSLSEGGSLNLVADGGDITFTGSGRYRIELSDVSSQTVYYMGAFDASMPDLNYGDLSKVEQNACFQDLAASADKWIKMGVDGLRLDAVKHICGGISDYNDTSNQTFLKAWYDHCNATYRSTGKTDNIFMVGEVWSSHSAEKNYYKGIPSCFEFGYWPALYGALVSQNASSYVNTVNGFINDHKAVRSDAVTSLFMTNHDHSSQTGGGEVRAADDLGRNLAREKQAAAMLLSTPGKPFIYQGEELGYWGNSKDRGDEYIRAPIVWDKKASDVAKKGVGDKVDADMLTGSISVEAQTADANSLLNTYKTWSRLRNTYPALADGTMTAAPVNGGAVAAWYMTGTDGSKLLVIHHTGSAPKTLLLSDDPSHPVALLGSALLAGKTLTLGANSSVVFQL